MPQIPDIPGMPAEISGAYVNADVGVEITFPDDWSGVETVHDSGVAVIVYKGGLGVASPGDMPASILLSATEKVEAEEEVPSDPSNEEMPCEVLSTAEVQAAGVKAVESVSQCTVMGETVKAKTTVVNTETRWVVVSYVASEDEYDADEGTYDSSVDTLEVEGAVDIEDVTEVVEETVNEVEETVDTTVTATLDASVQMVMVAGEEVEIEFNSSSTISDVSIDEETKTLSFTVDGEDGTEGTTEIIISSVLEGPYTVMIDGEVATNVEESTVEATGETMLTISYTHSTHDVTVTGTNVVPEFPVAVLGAVAAVIGIVAVLGRTRMFKPF
ncbi:hypothetical protein [Candidatus Nitrososphaera sp. FF02]|uniref:hypothetical protein n=1 Tax=Candidatus Nitrososphaera sp. FF02 TaxID=3398226 RepID=UPI0039E912DD